MEGEDREGKERKEWMQEFELTHLFQMTLFSRRAGKNCERSPTDSPHLQSNTGQCH